MKIGKVRKRLELTKNLLLQLFFCLFPIKKNVVVFLSFNGQYNDNPRYISEKLHELDPTVRIVWALNKDHWGLQPDYVKPVLVNSVKCHYYSSVAAVYVDNFTGKHAFRKNKRLSPMLRALKKKGQFNLSTWHGTPLKRIHNDIGNASICSDGCFTTCDVFVSGNAHLSKVISEGLCGNISVAHWGTPRNDLLLNRDAVLAEQIKSKNGFTTNEKIILYAPTFRNSILDSGIKQMELLDVPALLEALSDRFGGEWRLALRTHPGVYTQLRQYYGAFLESDDILDANQYPEMAEYLVIADALITDYSGSLFDYCLMNRPCFLFAHDLQNYSQKERGLYFEIKDLPFTFSNTNQELLDNIRSYSDEVQYAKVQAFQKRIGNYESGKASETAAKAILEKLREGV